MIRSARNIVAVLIADPSSNGLGLPATFDSPFGATTVLGHVLARLSRCRRLDGIVVVHNGEGVNVPLPDDPHVRRMVRLHAAGGGLHDPMRRVRLAARRFSPTSWRGGIREMTCYDEVLRTPAMREALEAADASAGLIVGAHWPLVDPALCDSVIERHREAPEHHRLVFTQAPPGLVGCLITTDLLGELDENHLSIGALLGYQPRRPQPDAIGKDVCVGIEPDLRNCRARFTCDAPRWRRLLDAIAEGADPDKLLTMEAVEAARSAAAVEHDRVQLAPRQVTLELTPRRSPTGPILPQSHVELDREPISLERAREIMGEITREPDVALTLGGLGDPLEHPQWSEVVRAAAQAGVWGIHLETDLLVDQPRLESLLELPIDVLSVRLNADTAQTYGRVMGIDGFDRVLDNIQWLLNHRGAEGRPPLPWIVPRMIKTRQNVHEMENFFDRWVSLCGHAVIEPATTGCGLMPDGGFVNMAPPRRRACRQLGTRISIHSDARVAQCSEDWRGQAAAGDLHSGSLTSAWQATQALRQAHEQGRWEQSPLCAKCREWHRP